MENFCFGTSASCLVKRKIVRIERQKFGYSAFLRILRQNFGTIKKNCGYILRT